MAEKKPAEEPKPAAEEEAEEKEPVDPVVAALGGTLLSHLS